MAEFLFMAKNDCLGRGSHCVWLLFCFEFLWRVFLDKLLENVRKNRIRIRNFVTVGVRCHLR